MRTKTVLRRAAAALLATASLALPAVSPTTAAAAPPDLTAAEEFVPGVGHAERTPDGLLRVRLADGSYTTTHGADLTGDLTGGDAHDGHDHVHGGVGDHVETFYPGPMRAPNCVTPNSSTDWPNPGRIELVYVQARGQADNFNVAAQPMRETLARMNWWVHQRGLQTSSNLVKIDLNTFCTGGQVHVSRMTSGWAGSDVTFQRLRDEMVGRGYTNRNAKYLVLFDDLVPAANGGFQTGIADFRSNCSNGANNPNNQSGANASSMFAFTWGRRFFYEDNTTTAFHELLHNLGAVQNCAPHRSWNAHCTDDIDPMCYDDDNNPGTFPMWHRCGTQVLDCGDDDYFDALPEVTEPLYNIWNVASLANRFVYWRM